MIRKVRFTTIYTSFFSFMVGVIVGLEATTRTAFTMFAFIFFWFYSLYLESDEE
jgi:hypothetical protein